MKTVLFIACSKKKSALARGRARDIYAGTLFRRALELGELRGWDCYIVSARYGIIRPAKVIDNYDFSVSVLRYVDWPKCDGRLGYYVGGRGYFELAPLWIRPLTADRTRKDCRYNGLQSQIARLNVWIAEARNGAV